MRFQNGTSNPPGMQSQIATASSKRNIRFMPYAFTEHGAIVAAMVLNSSKEDPSASPACPEQHRGAASGTRQDEEGNDQERTRGHSLILKARQARVPPLVIGNWSLD